MSYSKYTEHGVYTYTHICFGGQTAETCPTLCQSEFGTAVLLFFAGRVGSQSIRQLVNSKMVLFVHIQKVNLYEVLLSILNNK